MEPEKAVELANLFANMRKLEVEKKKKEQSNLYIGVNMKKRTYENKKYKYSYHSL